MVSEEQEDHGTEMVSEEEQDRGVERHRTDQRAGWNLERDKGLVVVGAQVGGEPCTDESVAVKAAHHSPVLVNTRPVRSY